MTNTPFLRSIELRQIFIFFIAFFSFSASITVKAQPEFSRDELQLLKDRKMSPAVFKYLVSQDKFPMPEVKASNGSNLADGTLDPTFNASVTEGSGYVNKTIVQPDGKIIIGGLFQRINGTHINGVTRLNTDGTLDTSFNSGTGANAAVRTIALQSDGKIIVGGAFTSFNGQAANRIVRLNADGSLDSSFNLTVAFNDQINDIAILSTGKLIVGGQFSLSSSRLVRLNVDGTLDAAISGFNSTVYTIAALSDGKILVGGGFTGRIVRLNADLTKDTTLNIGTGINGLVLTIAVQSDGKIIFGGAFGTYNGTPTDCIVRINQNGSVDSTFDFPDATDPLNIQVGTISLQPDGKILTSYIYPGNDGYYSFVKRFNTNATIDATFTTGDLNQEIATGLTVLNDGKIFVGGTFTSYNNQTHPHFVKLNQDGTFDNTFAASVSSAGIIYAIRHQADGKIVIAGDFDFVNGVRKTAIARLNPDGTIDNTFTFGSRLSGDIYDFEIQSDGKFVIGGIFTGFSTAPFSNAVRINSDGSFDIGLNFDESFVSAGFDVALQADNKILVGGQIFDTSNVTGIIRINPNGTLDTSFTHLSNNVIFRSILVQPSGKIVVGGTFNFPTNLPRTGLARLNSDGTFDVSFAGNCFNTYSLVGLPDGSFYAGGFFTDSCGGSSNAKYIARLNVDGIADPTFNSSNGANGGIRAIKIQPDGKVLMGGLFTTYAGSAANRIARINTNGTLDSTFNAGGSGATGNVYALDLQADGKILVGGPFLDFNNNEKFGLVRLQNLAIHKATPFDFDGDSKTDISIFRSGPGEWWYSRSSDGQVPAAQFGSGTDKIVPGDFTGDGKTDIAFWRPSTGSWFILRSEDGSFLSFPFGANGDIPGVGDFDADGKADPTIFRPSTGEWYILKSTGGTAIVTFGTTGDVPVPADYDGDGKSDIAIFRPGDGSWWYLRSSDSQFRVFRFGVSTDKPVQGDYTGDGKADIAVWRPSTGEWFVQRSEDNSFYSIPFGANGDIPAPGDYDGDGKFDTAVFRPSGSTWYVNRSTVGLMIQQFGLSTDLPVPSAFVP